MNPEDRRQKTEVGRRASSCYRSRGFSFTEILFAIMILGIGFIMVAAMFPVAIHQTETSRQETVGAALARSGVAYVQQMANVNFYQTLPTATPPGDKLCVLRPTVTYPGLNLIDDESLYKATLPGATVTLTPAVPPIYLTTAGTYVLPGQVWDFQSLGPNGMGAEHVAAIAGGPNGPNGYQTTSTYLSALLSSMASENMVQTADPRFAWIAFYKRDLIMTVTTPGTATYAFAPSAQVIVVATQVRTGQSYTVVPPPNATTPPPLDLPVSQPTPTLNLTPPSLQASRSGTPAAPAPATISFPDTTHVDFSVSFSDTVQAGTPTVPGRAAEGAFVIIANDFVPPAGGPVSLYHGQLNGRIYRLGAFDSARSSWNFAPGYGPSQSDFKVMMNSSNRRFVVYLVGRGQDPQNGNLGNYTGLAQDIAVYSTFISCPSN